MEDFSEPRNPLEAAANAALERFEELVIEAGGRPGAAMFFAWTEGLEPNAVSASMGGDDAMGDPREILAFLLAQATELAKALGLELKLINIGEG